MGELLGIARRAEEGAPIETVTTVAITQDDGIAGDYHGGVPRKRQVTVLSAEVWSRVCDELGADLPWTTRRANLLVSGVELPAKAGGHITIGALRLEICLETAPCELMDEAHQGLRAALTPGWRGGVCCRVLNDAEIAVGDSVSVVG